ncbi:MAG: DinB family protein [Calditrichota bacterium]|jgi:hypothetical protein
MDQEKILRERLLYVLEGKGAHVSFEDAIADFPEDYRGKKFPGLPYTAWQLLEHMRLSQWDILDFSRNPKYMSQNWPDDYWPKDEEPPDKNAWDNSIKLFLRDRKDMQSLVQNPSINLYTKIPHGSGQNILREALLVADHNAYHLGEMVLLRKIFGIWIR